MNLDHRLLSLVRGSRFAFLLTITLGFAIGILTVIQAGFLSRVIDQVYLGGATLLEVANQLLVLVGLMLMRAGLGWGNDLASSRVAISVKSTLRRSLVSRLFDLGPIYTSGEQSGELTNTLVEGVEALDNYYSQYLPQLILAAIVPLTLLVVIFPLDPLTGLILVVTAPLIPVFMALIGNYSKTLTERQWSVLSKMSAYFLDVIQGLTTLKTFGRSKAQVRVIAEVSDRYRKVTMGVLRITFLSAFVLELVATLSTAVVAVEIGLRLLYGRLAFQEALFILLLAPEFYLPLRMLGTRFHAGMSGIEAANRIFQVLENDSTEYEQGIEIDPNLVRQLLQEEDILLENVSYDYPDGHKALEEVSLRIPCKDTVALVGCSGAGKSTIGDMILRFLEPSSGSIKLGETPISRFSPNTWRSQVAWVSQNPYMINDSVKANIRMGRPEASLEEVMYAAEQANAVSFIQALPEGFDTLVGERGARLSGGQVQRIALARAFISESPLLVIDEGTANLDPENEALISTAMERLLIDKTALVIAHRMNTVLMADRIAVLDEGQVLQEGTHSQLIRVDGPYRRLVHATGEDLSFDRTRRATPGKPMVRPEVFRDAINDYGLDTKRTSTWHHLTRLIHLISPLRGQVILSVILGAAAIASGIGLMGASAYIISAAALKPSIADLQLAIVGVRSFGISRGVFRYLERYSSHQVTFRILARFRIWFYQSLEPLAPARLMRYRSGDLLARIIGDIETLENFYVRALAPPLVAILITMTMFLFLAQFDQRLSVVLVAFFFAAGVGVPLLGRWLGRETGSQLVKTRAKMQTVLVDGIQGMADLKAYNQEARVVEDVSMLDTRLAAIQHKLASIRALGAAFSVLLAHSGMWTILVLGVILVQTREIEGVYLAVITLATLASFEAVLPLYAAAIHLESEIQAAGRLFDVVDAEPEVRDTEPFCTLGEPIDIEVENLHFRYPPSLRSDSQASQEDAWILSEVSFNLPHGKKLAIVGPSGAGKSTLISLLLRYWEYQSGRIHICGQDLRECQQDQIRSCVAVVNQNTYLFSASIRDNLLIGRPTATQDEIVQAAQQAQLHEFIQNLPDRYDTWIGERGARLSGGERQRLAIARALIRNSPILILDEPTANLDTLTERRILETLHQLMVGRSTLLATHRLIGMPLMDVILVMEGGRIVERGTHKHLVKNGGLYQRLWGLQNQRLIE